MSFRTAEVYIQPTTKRRLRWLARAIDSGPKPLSADELADKFLNKYIEQHYPGITQLEQEAAAAEQRFSNSLRNMEQAVV